jgi:diaminopimelate epimerase
MMHFTKYHGAGNDFVIVLADRTTGALPFDAADDSLIQRICDRHFGVGADGLIALRPAPGVAFEMLYFNADGRRGSLCGNGSRCAVRAALDAGWLAPDAPNVTFLAADGLHTATFLSDGLICLSMNDAPAPTALPDDVPGVGLHRVYHLDTGSPHVVVLRAWGLNELDIIADGRQWRHDARFAATGGVNANFAERLDGSTLRLRTYERGVEAETLACGTGVTATALVAAHHYGTASPIRLLALGGELLVAFERRPDGSFTNVTLTGPAERVFEGNF